jgi:hypothetical protein
MAALGYVDQAHRMARRVSRLSGALLAGGRLLTPTAPLLAARDRYLTARPVETENSGFVWARAGQGWTTQVWVHNYWSWSDAYQIEQPCLRATLLDTDGVAQGEWAIEPAPDGTVAVDVAERCRALNVPLPFEGQLLLRLRHPRLRQGRPLQVIGEYVHDDGARAVVHGQYGLMRVPVARVSGNMRAVAGGGRRTGVILLNPYDGPGREHDMRMEAVVSSHDGRRRRVALPSLRRRAMRRAYLDDLVPDLDAFLDGQPGSFEVRLPCGGTRVTTFQEDAAGAMVMNHGTLDRRFHHEPGLPAEWAGSTPVASTFAVCTATRDTVLTLVNNWGPPEAPYHVDVALHDRAGSPVASSSVLVPAGHVRSLSLRSVLAAAGRLDVTVAHAEVRLRPASGKRGCPIRFDVLVGLLDGDRLLSEVQVGSELYNAPSPRPDWPDIRRTRTFGRALVGEGLRTWLFVGYPVGGPAPDGPAATTVSLLDPAGSVRGVCEVELAPHGFLHAAVDELFPDAGRLLGPAGAGTVRVRSTAARFFGYHAVEAPGAGTVAVDHLIGG